MAIHCRAAKNSLRGTVIVINSVLALQVSTASLPHDCEPCEIKVVSNQTVRFIPAFAPGRIGCAYA
jgi:hypothetical protein